MVANDILNEDVSDFATRLEAMTSDEVFAAMSSLYARGRRDRTALSWANADPLPGLEERAASAVLSYLGR
jgi:hypothetical protein